MNCTVAANCAVELANLRSSMGCSKYLHTEQHFERMPARATSYQQKGDLQLRALFYKINDGMYECKCKGLECKAYCVLAWGWSWRWYSSGFTFCLAMTQACGILVWLWWCCADGIKNPLAIPNT